MRSLLNVRLDEAHMTKKQLGEKTGYGRTALWRWSTDKGIESITLRAAARVAEALGCKPQDLFED